MVLVLGCFSLTVTSILALQTEHSSLTRKGFYNISKIQLNPVAIEGTNSDLYGQHVVLWTKMRKEWSFKRGSISIAGPTMERFVLHRKSSGVQASCEPPFFKSTKHFYLCLILCSYHKFLEICISYFTFIDESTCDFEQMKCNEILMVNDAKLCNKI